MCAYTCTLGQGDHHLLRAASSVVYCVIQCTLTVPLPPNQSLAGLGDIAEDLSPTITQPQQPQQPQQLASFPGLPPPARASLSSARVLDTAMRIYVMMSQLHSRGSEGHIECCLAALGYCCLLWKVQSSHQLGAFKYCRQVCVHTYIHMYVCMLYTMR